MSTTSSSTRGADAGLVPLHERLRYMLAFRGVVALAVLALWVALPSARHVSLLAVLSTTAAYLGAAAATRGMFRHARSKALRLFSLTLLADGIYLAFVSYATAGFGSPLQYLVVLHLVAVTLLASFRSGVKIALWHSLLVSAAASLQTDGLLRGGAPAGRDLVLFLALVWMATLFTASFAAVNERELRRRNYDLQALARLSWQLESALQPQEVGEALVAAIEADFDAKRQVLLVRQENTLVPLAGRDVRAVPGLAPENDRLLAQSLRERRTLRLATPPAEENPWLAASLPGARNVLTVPLYSDGAPLGLLVVETDDSRGARIELRTVEMLERFVSQAALALANARLLVQVRALAAADGLTGVANRRTFDARLPAELARAIRNRRPLSLVLLDVDHFKRLNDTFGHQTGDETLQRVAGALQASARTVDLVARYGGEEFVLVLPDTDRAGAYEVAERLRATLEAMTAEPTVTASFGVASFPATALDPAALISAADEALYAAKQFGRNRVELSRRTAPASPADVLHGGDTGAGADAGPAIPEQPSTSGARSR